MNKIKSAYILLGFFLVALNYSCERTDLQTSAPNDSVQITTRGNCDDCPGANECCCSIEYLSGDYGYFSICGTTSGDAVECEVDPSPCENDVNGLQHSSFLLNNSTNQVQYFCVNENAAIRIQRLLTTSGTTYVRITCQRGQMFQQWIPLYFTDDERVFFDTNGSCILAGPCGN